MAPQQKIVSTEALASSSCYASVPMPGKWWLKRDAQDWGAPGGTILLAGEPSQEPLNVAFWDVIPLRRFVPYRVPELVIDPEVTGWHRIYVGVYCDDIDDWSRPRLQGKLSDEPFPEYLQAPFHAKGRTAEVYWKAADLTGRQIHISQPPGPLPHVGSGWMGGITHLRLVPMTKEETTKAQTRELKLPPVDRRLFAMLDATDELYWWGSIEREADIHAIIWRHQQTGFGRIYWRCFGTYLDNALDEYDSSPRWTAEDEAAYCAKAKTTAGWAPYIDISRRFDPLKVAVEYGNTIDCEVHGMVRFCNFNRAPYANFYHDHPEYLAQTFATEKNAAGKSVIAEPRRLIPWRRLLSMAYPEVRAFYVRFFKQIAATGTRGIMIDMLRHPPIAGYEPIVTEAFKAKYGRDMWELNLFEDPLVQEHMSGYLHAFLVELRKAIGAGIEISVRTCGPDGFGLRGKQWIEEGLIDTIVDGQWPHGNKPRSTIDATVAAAGSRGKAMAAADYFDADPKNDWAPRPGPVSAETIAALAQAYSGRGVSAFGLYESTVFTWCPDLRRAIREAGWKFEPQKRMK